jgi:hypothetical protein
MTVREMLEQLESLGDEAATVGPRAPAGISPHRRSIRAINQGDEGIDVEALLGRIEKEMPTAKPEVKWR